MTEQVKTLHFWLMMVGVGVSTALGVGLIHAGTGTQVAAVALALLQAAGVQVAAKWQPQAIKDQMAGKIQAPPIPPAAVILPLLAVTTFSACSYCSQDVHKTEARCQVQAIAQSCGTPAITKLVNQILPEVVADLVSMDFTPLLGQLVQTLEHQGVTDALVAVTCAVQQADGNITLPAGGMPSPNLIAVKTHAQIWVAANKARR